MTKKNSIITANDNQPVEKTYRAFGVKHALFARNSPAVTYVADENDHNYPTYDADISKTNRIPKKNSNVKNRSLKLSVILWLTALLMGLSHFVMETTAEFKAISALSVFWAGLWTSYVAADYNKWRLSEISMVSALGGLMGTIILIANYIGLNLNLIDGIILTSLLSLVMGYLFNSRIAVLASICATLLWATMSLLGMVPINNLIALFPLLCLVQIHSSSKIKSNLAVGLSVLTGYFGIIGLLMTLMTNNLLPLTYAASLLFIVGIAHHRIGKAAKDSHISGSHIHTMIGWVVAIASAIIFQHFWLSPEALPATESEPSQTFIGIWKTIVALSIFAIFVSGIIRFKHSQITLPGIFLLTFCSSFIPLMLWAPQLPEMLAANIPGLEPTPSFGLIIGAGILAAGIGLAFNGLRQKSWTMILMGLAALFIETSIIMKPAFFNADTIIIFIASFIAALSIGGAIAGNSLAFQTPAPRPLHA